MVTFAILGAIAGAVGGAAWGGGERLFLTVIGGIVLGALVGNSRAFALRLQAQTALCQVQIEENTRRPGAAVGASSAA